MFCTLLKIDMISSLKICLLDHCENVNVKSNII